MDSRGRTGTDRASLEVEDLLKIVLGLAIVWLILEILDLLLDITFAVFRMLPTLIGIVLVVVIVLWLTDRI
ncbi:hypothetical protein ACFQAS_11615 [Halopenitus salinus]|jgi:hypothetical protein|uniref:Uncharacterized protein n=1 Tax=Halopenitus salinus TaxID=1198295 RepID=A0ABD5UTH7_9EURY